MCRLKYRNYQTGFLKYLVSGTPENTYSYLQIQYKIVQVHRKAGKRMYG